MNVTLDRSIEKPYPTKMSNEPSSKNAKTEATSQESDGDVNKNDDQLPVAVPAAQENACEIFKLDVDCCEELFEWLSIKDLHSMGQTCKRMHRIAGMYFQRNYPNANIQCKRDGIYFDSTRVNGFSECIENIYIESFNDSTSKLKYIAANCKSLKKIEFYSEDPAFTGRLHLISDVLAKVENIIFRHKYFDKNILDLCPNLKKLEFGWSHTDWLFKLNKCPKLEHIRFFKIEKQVNVEAFFNQIPNISSIGIHWRFLLNNRTGLLGVNTKLENLTIDFWHMNVDEISFCVILNELYDRGFYKRLRFIYMAGVTQQWIDRMVSLRALETLSIFDIESGIVWPVMQNIKKISMSNVDQFDSTTLPSKLPNLQRILLDWCNISMEAILPFIRGLKKLSRLIILYSESHENILDLSALNKEREKLAGACKVTIYVPEAIFLEIKFANGARSSLIEIKRMESLELNEYNFSYSD